jgi:hypothetical protein
MSEAEEESDKISDSSDADFDNTPVDETSERKDA